MHESSCDGALLLVKLQATGLQFYKERISSHVPATLPKDYSVKTVLGQFYKFFQNNFFNSWMTVFGYRSKLGLCSLVDMNTLELLMDTLKLWPGKNLCKKWWRILCVGLGILEDSEPLRTQYPKRAENIQDIGPDRTRGHEFPWIEKCFYINVIVKLVKI